MAWNSARPPGEGAYASGGAATVSGKLADGEKVLYNTDAPTGLAWINVGKPGWVNIVFEFGDSSKVSATAPDNGIGVEILGCDEIAHDLSTAYSYGGLGPLDSSAAGKTVSKRLFFNHDNLALRWAPGHGPTRYIAHWVRDADGTSGTKTGEVTFNAAKTRLIVYDDDVDGDDRTAAVQALRTGDIIEINGIGYRVGATPTDGTNITTITIAKQYGDDSALPGVGSSVHLYKRVRPAGRTQTVKVIMRPAASDERYYLGA